jgi:hypothetical protein
MTTNMSTQERPVVSVQAQTANTTGVKIIANSGTAWLVISHDCITVKAEGLEVEVRP